VADYVGGHESIDSLIAAARREAIRRGSRLYIYAVPQPHGWLYAPFSVRRPWSIGRAWPKEE